MDFGLFKSIVDEATRYGKRSFSLHLFGEPLLYKNWFEAIQYIKSKNKRHTVLFTTNGTLLERFGNLDKLIASGADQVYWSWREEAKFSEETKKRLKKWGKFRVRIIEEVTPKEELEKWKTWGNIEYRKLHNYGGNINTDSFQTDSPVETSSLMKEEERWPCYHLWLAPAVAWNGKILICCSDPHQAEVLGQFPAVTVHEIWVGAKLKEIRDSHLRGEYGGICKNCDVWKTFPSIF